MKLDLTGLLNETVNRLTVKESLAVNFADDEIYLSGPLDVDIDFFKAGDIVIGRGRVKAKVKQVCSRCLQDLEESVTFDLFEQFQKDLLVKAERGEIELGEEDFIFPINDDGSIDVADMIRQNLIANLPEKALCRNDCPGIKSDILGKKKIDPRLEILKEAL